MFSAMIDSEPEKEPKHQGIYRFLLSLSPELAVVPRGRLRRRKSDFATAPGSCENRNSTKDLAFYKKNIPQCFFVVVPIVFHDYARSSDPDMGKNGEWFVHTTSASWTSPLQARSSR